MDNLLPAYVKTNGQSINNSSSVSEELQQSILNMTGVEQDSKYADLQKVELFYHHYVNLNLINQVHGFCQQD